MGTPVPRPWDPGTSRGAEAVGESDPPHRGAAALRADRGSREEADLRARIQPGRETEDHRRHLREHRAGAVPHATARAHRESGHAAGRSRHPGDRREPSRDRDHDEGARPGGRREQHDHAARSGAQDGPRNAARKRDREKTIVAINCRAVTKRFGDVVAVAGLDLTVRAGECFGLLGPNGAGKTTTIEICEGLLAPDAGTVELLGMRWENDAPELRQRLGVQLQETQLSEKLTVDETVRLFRSFYRCGPSVAEVIAMVQLEEKRSSRVGGLSGGQKQRLAMACALVGDPDLLFLDEPTTGLDPQARRQLWELIERFKTEGRTIVLTTHYMDEAERLCDRVAIMDHGKVIAEGTPRELVAS